MDTKIHYNCEVMTTSVFIFGYIASACGALLIVLRIIAIWGKMKFIIAISALIWGINVAFLTQGIVRIRSTYVETVNSCLVLNFQTAKLNVLSSLVTDILLLLIMLIGLLRMRYHEHGAFSMGRLMWRQSLIWLFVAIVTGFPPAVLIFLNTNDPYLYMFFGTSLVTLSIAATRIHRSLIDFAYENTEMYNEGTLTSAARNGRPCHASNKPRGLKTLSSGRTDPKVNRSASLFTLPNRMEVEIHMAYEEYQIPPSTDSGSVVNAEEVLYEKPAGLRSDDDVEKIV